MANNCYNYISISGDQESLDKLLKVFNQENYNRTNYFTQFGDSIFGKEQPSSHYENQSDYNFFYKYGTKWFEFNVDTSPGFIQINGDSAWGPPLELFKQISKEYGLYVSYEYSEPGMDFAGILKIDNGEVIEKWEGTASEYEWKEDEDSFYCNYIEWRLKEEGETIEEILEDFEWMSQKDKERLIKEIIEQPQTN